MLEAGETIEQNGKILTVADYDFKDMKYRCYDEEGKLHYIAIEAVTRGKYSRITWENSSRVSAIRTIDELNNIKPRKWTCAYCGNETYRECCPTCGGRRKI